MLQLALLDPKLLMNPDPDRQDELWKSIARTCGWTRGKIIAEIPRNLSHGHHLKSGPGRIRLLERIRLAQTRLCLLDPPVIAPDVNWASKGDSTPWVTALVSDEHPSTGLKPRLCSEEFWDLEHANHISCAWTNVDLERAIQMLFRKTRRIDVLDRYLGREKAFQNLQRILQPLVDARCMETQRPELVLHFSPDEGDRSIITAPDSSILSRFKFRRPMPFNLKIFMWKKEGLHSRYLLADHGGLTVGESLTWPLGEPVDFTLMNAHLEKRAKYSPNSDHGRKFLIREVQSG